MIIGSLRDISPTSGVLMEKAHHSVRYECGEGRREQPGVWAGGKDTEVGRTQKPEVGSNEPGSHTAVWSELEDKHGAGWKGKRRLMADLCMVCAAQAPADPAVPGGAVSSLPLQATAAGSRRWVPGTDILRM